jgi:glycosyltransferase involved in cell wall biosynthesis
MMKILIISQYFWPENFRINDVTDSLAKSGCEITVLTGQPNYPNGKIFSGYSATNFGMQINDSGYRIYRVPIVPRGKCTPISLLLNYLSFIFSTLFVGSWLLRKQQFDIIFVYAPSPIFQVIPAVWLSYLKNAKLITWVQDLWPQSLEVTGYVKNAYLLKTVTLVVRWIYARCDLLLVQSRSFLEPVRELSNLTPVVYHPNPGLSSFSERRTTVTPALSLKSGFNVVFAGNLGRVQSLHTILDAAEQLLPFSDVCIVIIGSGSCYAWLSEEVCRKRLSNIILAGHFQPDEMPSIFEQASALLVSLKRSPIMSHTVPSKIQTYLAAGRPIIGSLDGEGARLLEESRAGISCPAEDAISLTNAIIRLRSLPYEQLKLMGDSGKAYYRKHYDPDLLTKKLLKLFSSTLNLEK